MYEFQRFDDTFLLDSAPVPTYTDWQIFEQGVKYGIEGISVVGLKTMYDSWTDDSPILSDEEFNEKYKPMGVKKEEGMTKWEADIALQAKDEQMKYQIMTNHSDEIRWAYIAGIGLPMLFDPINFVGAGAAVFASRMVRTGKLLNTLKAVSNPIVDGALTGFAGEMATIKSRKLRQEDWGVAEVAAGTYFGGAWGMIPWGDGRAALRKKGANSVDTEVDQAKAAQAASHNDDLAANANNEPNKDFDPLGSDKLTPEGQDAWDVRQREIDLELEAEAKTPRGEAALDKAGLSPEARQRNKEAYLAAVDCKGKRGA